MNDSKNKSVAFHSFGCKLNQSETQTLEDGFKKRGYDIVSFEDKADYYVVDTCTVTDQADAKARNIIRKAERTNPEAHVIVTGCMAQMEATRIKEINPRALIIGTFEKMNMFEILSDVESTNDWDKGIFVTENKIFQSSKTAEDSNRTRAYLKVQDGCNYICSFCIIPFSRGRDRSSILENVILEAEDLIKQGFKEITLTGVNIGEYKDNGRRIEDLVEAISDLKGLERLRISSIEPNTVSDRLLDIISERSNIMPHMHIPIQSGSSEILKKMRRHYDRYGIEKILDRICKKLPNLALGSDFIVGFPSETDENFNDTVSLIESYPFTYYHTFTYSSRQKTIAEKMEGHINSHIKFSRSEYLRKLAEVKKLQFAEKNIGKSLNLLIEGQNVKGYINGFTENYIKVNVESTNSYENQLKKIEIIDAKTDFVLGKFI
jgi:threonylcarbamoyladenosine tRNA methylthiotransferase MtaB